MTEAQALNDRGQWVPSIPEPLFIGRRLGRCQCECGVIRKTRLAYREHYALVHILALS